MHFTFEKNDEFLCYCGEEFLIAEKSCAIRPSVCRDLPKYGEIDGKSYCVLHFPGKDKVADFIPVFEQRFEEKTFDFRGVWFPCEVGFGETFESDVNFSYATFSDNAEFMQTTFAGKAIFDHAKFLGFAAFETAIFKKDATFWRAKFLKDPSFFDITFEDEVSFQNAVFYEVAHFGGTKFLAKSHFSSVEFLKGCYFSGAEFSGYASFESVKFYDNCDFSETVFANEADFGYSVFEENSDAVFRHTYFKNKADFRFVTFKSYIHFEGGNYKYFAPFSPDNEFIGEDRFTHLFGNEADFVFLRTEDAKKVTFYKSRLRPSWFVNVDLQRFVFIDCFWVNCEGSEEDIKIEIQKLKESELSNPNYLLTIAYRNLAENAERKNQIKEVAMFRKMIAVSQQYG